MRGKADHKVKLLGNVSLFAACTDRELKKIASLVDEVSFKSGEALTKEGFPGTQAFVIADGTASVRVGKKKVATVGPGDVVGEMSLLDRGPRVATVIADAPMRAFVLDARQFNSVLNEVPIIAKKILVELAGRIRALEKSPTH